MMILTTRPERMRTMTAPSGKNRSRCDLKPRRISMLGLNGRNKITEAPKTPSAPASPKQLHPAAMEAAAQWSEMLDQCQELRATVARLQNDLTAERKYRAHLEGLLEEERADKD